MELLTNSRMSALKRCQRYHYFRYELGWTRARETEALSFGVSFHDAIDRARRGEDCNKIAEEVKAKYLKIPVWLEDAEYEDRLHWEAIGVNVAATFLAYEDFYAEQEPLRTVASELPFDLGIANPRTGRQSRSFRAAGKTDAIVETRGRLALFETKTTTDDISPESDYWKRLRLDQQISLYYLAALALGYEIKTVVYDVIRRPLLRRKMATPPEKRKYKRDGELYAGQRAAPETLNEYEARLRGWLDDNRENIFIRREIPRLTSDLREFTFEMWDYARQIRECRRSGIWPRNCNACFKPWRCEFVDPCYLGVEPNEELGFKRLDDVNPELKEGGSNG